MSRYVKILNESLTHHYYKYNLGLNVDNKPWSEYSPDNGLHFCKSNDIHQWISYGKFIADVTIPPNAKVKHFSSKSKASSINISNIRPISDYLEELSTEELLYLVLKNTSIYKFIKQPTDELHKLLLKKNPAIIKYIDGPSKELQLVAVNSDGLSLQYIDNPSKDIQLAAVRRNGRSIQYIDNPSKDIQLAAVEQNGLSLQYIPNPFNETKFAAIHQNKRAIMYIGDNNDGIEESLFKQYFSFDII